MLTPRRELFTTPAFQLGVSSMIKSWLLALLLFLVSSFAAFAQQPNLAGTWETKDTQPALSVTFNGDGTGLLEGAPIKYVVRGSQLIVDEQGTVNAYTFRLDGDSLVVSGANIKTPLTFTRRNTSGFGRRAATTNQPPEKEKGLTGRWKSSEATVQINDDGTLILNGSSFRYVVKGNVIVIGNDEGVMQFPFELKGDTLNVEVDGRTVVYKRIAGDAAESSSMASGSLPMDLVGKWCYMSNVNSSGGGRMSNRCFTLYENGTYEFYAETSSSGPVASSASQEYDSGTWSATANTITRNSRSLGTQTYPLEKRNHPKTGDPMLVLDGDAYVTYSPRQPW